MTENKKESTHPPLKRYRSNSMGNSVAYAGLLLIELILLALKFIYTTVESIIRTFLPPLEKSLKDEVILITGAGHGIGRELALLFAVQNAIIVCWDLDEKGNNETKHILKIKGYKRVYTYKVDVSNRQEVLDAAALVKQEVGSVSVLVNNAGIMPCRPLFSQSHEVIEKIFNVNVLAHFWALEAFLPSMIENNHGHVIALSSMCGVIGLPNVVPYCASKFAVRGLMEALYEELRVGDTKNNKSEIKFTTVYPIMVNTGLVKKPRNRFPFLLDMQSPEKVANIIVKSMRRNYKEVSIPWMLMPLDRISRLLPGKFIQNVKDFIDTGLDPHTDD
ncbi:estradiol 17-beta-dehydrogenase 11 [Acyrthosiphon pisum]|uniref:Short-chain dehydrogenase/reductase 3 n=1 Tax=Acyrthosiphon pisum TaxID=7029 RepID=A0A8R1W5H7_ACYPI|nr:estradiol 17-beta-dehydrogenase 11 [Acyrthosiphon pisum]XP_016661277.1 estradiol 17-beta-dehydrogenase 11 [Acyrthosiphon pisum]XP_060869021.1 estradiol 17-beta-dehydrogenase 11-like [Metopolophium dirhodum]XP_060869023.1 estradiol 17-beta-dehydrogenase 11-like [Metopolophium dirhodum]|eukprot:XP_001951338.1 PREDICTED: estradiol 17-beta-dehydrogenase 11 [Acyrthosiphon pisum]